MAHKKGQGSTKNNRDSISKRLGVKIYGGQAAIPGNIIIRQRGTRYHPGHGVGIGKDHTIYATTEGIVTFTTKRHGKKVVHVLPIEDRINLKGLDPTNQSNNTTVQENGHSSKAVAANDQIMDQIKEKEEKPAAKKQAKQASSAKKDDLTKIEGIGPKTAELLQNNNISSYNDLVSASVNNLKEILKDAGSVYAAFDPTTWPKQAKMAADGDWANLSVYQEKLDGGVEVSSEEE